MSSPTQTVQSKQLHEPGVASALGDEGDSGNEDDGTQTNSDATVRPVTLPDGACCFEFTTASCTRCHVKSGIACFQMPENPELLDDLKFENKTSSRSGNLSQKRRTDCKRRLSNRPEDGKLKIGRDNHPQRSSIPTGTTSASFVFWHHGSGSTTGDRSNVSRQKAEDPGEQGSSDFARYDAEDLNNTGVLQSVHVWTRKTDANADTWEAAIRHFSKVGVSSCFLMEIDKGCLQPSVFDDSIFGEYSGGLVKKRSTQLGTCCENPCQSKPLSGVPKKPMVEFVM